MFKKIIGALLIFAMVFTLFACNKVPDAITVEVPEGKVAILIPKEEHYPEDYAVIAALKKEYPDTIQVYGYSDTRRLTPGDPEILTVAKEVASNEDIKAIIFARAGYFTYSAVQAAKNINKDLFIAAVEPEEDMARLNELVDLTVCADRKLFARDIITASAQRKAKYFVFFEEPRYTKQNFLYMNFPTYLEEACNEKGIEFVKVTVKDSLSEDRDIAVDSYRTGLEELYKSEKITGENVVLYSLNPDMQVELIDMVNRKGLIYIAPQFPTAYSGVREFYNMPLPENIRDTGLCLSSLKSKLKATEDKGRFSAYNYSLSNRMQRGILFTVFDVLNGKAKGTTVQDLAIIRLNNTEYDKRFSAQDLPGEEKSVQCYASGFEKIK